MMPNKGKQVGLRQVGWKVAPAAGERGLNTFKHVCCSQCHEKDEVAVPMPDLVAEWCEASSQAWWPESRSKQAF